MVTNLKEYKLVIMRKPIKDLYYHFEKKKHCINIKIKKETTAIEACVLTYFNIEFQNITV